MLVSLNGLIKDAQKENLIGGGAVWDAADVERDGPHHARPLLDGPYKLDPGSDRIWRVVNIDVWCRVWLLP